MTTIGYFQFFAEPYVMTGGRRTAERDALGGPAHVQGRLPLVEHGLRRGDRVRALSRRARPDRRPVPPPEGPGRREEAACAAVPVHAALLVGAAVALTPLVWMVAGLDHAARRGERVSAAVLSVLADPDQLRRALHAALARPRAREQPARRPARPRSASSSSTRWRATPSPSCASRAATASSPFLVGRAGHPGAGRDAAALPDAALGRPRQHVRRRDPAGRRRGSSGSSSSASSRGRSRTTCSTRRDSRARASS